MLISTVFLLALAPSLAPSIPPPAPVPQLSVTGGALGTSATYQLAGTVNVALFPELLALGTSTIPGGIDLGALGSLLVVPAFAAQGNGSHVWSFPIPLDPSAAGATVHAQAAGWAFDLQTLQGGYHLSNAVSLQLAGVPPAGLTYASNPASYSSCSAIAPNAPTLATGTATSYSVTPQLPSGLRLDPQSGVITGSPSSVTAGPQTYVVQASNPFGSAMASLSLGVDSVLQGTLTYSSQNPTYVVGSAIPTNTPSIASHPGISYAVTLGALPTGLQLSMQTGELTGTPLTPAPTTPITIAATACDGKQLTTVLSIAIAAPTPKLTKAAYVCNLSDDTISMYVQNTATGQLRHNGYVHTGAGTGPRAIATNAAGTFAFVACNTTSTLLSYAIDPVNGRLTASGTSVASAGSPVGAAVEPLGRYLYSANSSGIVRSYSIAAATGQLTPTSVASIAAGTQSSSIAVDALARFVYVANAGSDNVSGYAINGATGNLTALAGSPFAAGDMPQSLAIDPSGGFLYVANAGTSDSVSAFAIHPATGALTPLAGSPYAAGNDPTSLAISSDGDEVYTSNTTAGTLSVYARETTSGVLTAGAAVTTGTGPVSVAVDPAGAFAYSVNLGDAEIRAYGIGALAALTPVAPFEVRARSSPRAIVFAPSPTITRFTTDAVYAANLGANDFNQFSAHATSGELSALPPATVGTAGTSPNSIAVHPTADFLYVTFFNAPGTQVEAFSLAASGAATSLGIQATTSGNFATVIEPSGRFAYTSGGAVGSGRVTPFKINATTGALTAGANAVAGDVPRGAAVHPNGKWLYVANLFSNNVSQYQINAIDGALTPLAPATIATGSAPQSIAIDPSGRFAYVVATGASGAGGGTLSMYSISASTGVLTPLSAAAPSGFDDPFDVVVHPNGRFVYVADQFAQNIRSYAINTNPGNATEDGSLVLLNSKTVSQPIRFMQVNAAGTFLYVGSESASAASQVIVTYAIDGASSVLTSVDLDATGSGTRGIGLRNRVE